MKEDKDENDSDDIDDDEDETESTLDAMLEEVVAMPSPKHAKQRNANQNRVFANNKVSKSSKQDTTSKTENTLSQSQSKGNQSSDLSEPDHYDENHFDPESFPRGVFRNSRNPPKPRCPGFPHEGFQNKGLLKSIDAKCQLSVNR